MNIKIREIISQLSTERISEERKRILQPLIQFISSKLSTSKSLVLPKYFCVTIEPVNIMIKMLIIIIISFIFSPLLLGKISVLFHQMLQLVPVLALF